MAESQELLQRLRDHLQQVHDDPLTPFDQKLFDTASYIFLPELGPEQSQSLVLQIYQLLPTLQQDPEPVTRLLAKLLEPVSLATILSFEPQVDLLAGLDLAAKPYHVLTLSILAKADAASAQNLATSQPQIFISLVRLWLATEDEGAADKAGSVLLHLLEVDKDESEMGGWDGSVWKRVFRDKDVYGQIYSICSFNSQEPVSLSKQRKTVAQARLLDWIPPVAEMDWETITQSYIPEIEKSFGLNPGYEGLLDFAAVHMVDFKSDVLMHRSLISFFTTLITTVTNKSTKIGTDMPKTNADSSLSLDFLTTRGLHSRTLAYYIQPDDPSHDPLDSTFLYGPAANYVASYISTYPQSFGQSGDLQHKVIKKVSSTIHLSDSRWRHSHSPSEDLHVLSCIPRPLLVTLGTASPHLLLPSKFPNPDILHTLATLFHGPLEDTTITFPSQPEPTPSLSTDPEALAAKALYYSYISTHDTLWADVITHATTPALVDAALAATTLVKAVVTAPWGGIDAVMAAPARRSVVPWLVGPPKTFGGVADGHGAAYRVALAKFECLRAFWDAVRDEKRFGVTAVQARRRLRDGVLGGAEGERSVGTLEL